MNHPYHFAQGHHGPPTVPALLEVPGTVKGGYWGGVPRSYHPKRKSGGAFLHLSSFMILDQKHSLG